MRHTGLDLHETLPIARDAARNDVDQEALR